MLKSNPEARLAGLAAVRIAWITAVFVCVLAVVSGLRSGDHGDLSDLLPGFGFTGAGGSSQQFPDFASFDPTAALAGGEERGETGKRTTGAQAGDSVERVARDTPDDGNSGGGLPQPGSQPNRTGGKLPSSTSPEKPEQGAAVTVKPPKLPDVTVKPPKLPDVTVKTPKLPDVTVKTPKLPDVTVKTPKLPDVKVKAPKLPDVTVKTPKAPKPPEPPKSTPSPRDVTVDTPDLPDVTVSPPKLPDVTVDPVNASQSADSLPLPVPKQS